MRTGIPTRVLWLRLKILSQPTTRMLGHVNTAVCKANLLYNRKAPVTLSRFWATTEHEFKSRTYSEFIIQIGVGYLPLSQRIAKHVLSIFKTIVAMVRFLSFRMTIHCNRTYNRRKSLLEHSSNFVVIAILRISYELLEYPTSSGHCFSSCPRASVLRMSRNVIRFDVNTIRKQAIDCEWNTRTLRVNYELIRKFENG